MKVCNTWEAKIYVGLRVGLTKDVFDIKSLEYVCQKYVDEIGWCITVTPTKFIYQGGNEEGAIIGIMHYPRFPTTTNDLSNKGITLAQLLMKEFKQYRVSIVLPETTIMFENDEMFKEEKQKNS